MYYYALHKFYIKTSISLYRENSLKLHPCCSTPLTSATDLDSGSNDGSVRACAIKGGMHQKGSGRGGAEAVAVPRKERGKGEGQSSYCASVPDFAYGNLLSAACRCQWGSTDDRWSPVRFALVSHQLTDLQAPSPPASPLPALCCSVSCFWFACFAVLDATFTFHVISRTSAPGGQIRLLFCHLPIWERRTMMPMLKLMMMSTRRHCLWSTV